MGDIDRRGFIKLGASSMAVFALSPLLTACGSGGSVQSASSPIPASKAFRQKGVWFQFNNKGIVDKDETIKSALIFDGAGSVAYYPLSHVTFSDLQGKTNDLEGFVKESHRENFESKRSDASSRLQEEIGYAQSRYDKTARDKENGVVPHIEKFYFGATADELNEYYDEELRPLSSRLEALKGNKSIVDSLEYQEPSFQTYTLRVKTDGSGNATASESLQWAYTAVDWGTLDSEHLTTSNGAVTNNVTAQYMNDESDIDLVPDSVVQDVYDMHFRGFDKLVTIVDEKHAGFTLDDPKTDGVEVD